MSDADPTVRPRTVRLLEYLEAVRSIRELPVRDVAEYQDKRWWAGDIPEHPSCVVSATGDEPWLKISKAQVPAPPPPPDDIQPYLLTGVTDPHREPAFAANFDDLFAADTDDFAEPSAEPEEQAEATRLKDLLREYVE